MKKTKFARMREISKEKDMDDLEIGCFFLYGQNIIGQKGTKEVGQPITYYQVVEKNGANVVYTPIYDTLQEG